MDAELDHLAEGYRDLLLILQFVDFFDLAGVGGYFQPQEGLVELLAFGTQEDIK